MFYPLQDNDNRTADFGVFVCSMFADLLTDDIY